MESKANDKHIVEEAINDLLHLKKQLAATEEASDFQKGANTAAVLFAESINARIEYLKDVLTWYDDTPDNCGAFEVMDSYKQLITLAQEMAEDCDNEFNKGMSDSYLKFAFQLTNLLNTKYCPNT